MKVRKAIVAGQFYPREKEELIALIEQIKAKEADKIDLSLAENEIIGAVLPHAGYIYSGYEVIHYFEILKQSKQPIDTFIIITPNHKGRELEIAFDDNHKWETPLGQLKVDTELMNYMSFSKYPEAHYFEHSGEVMLPFIQYYFAQNVKILPISIGLQNITNAKKVVEQLTTAIKITGRKVQIIASSDFSHYVSPELGMVQDDILLKAIFNLRVEDVYNSVKKYKITACGYGPIMSLIHYSLKSDSKPKVKILKRGHSGETNPSEEVVDYISILFYK